MADALSTAPQAGRTSFTTSPSVPTLVAPRTYRYCATSDLQDRYGDIVDPDGAEIANYQRNPIVLFSHDPRLWIGRCLQLIHEKTAKVNRWLGDILFADNALGDDCEKGAASGILVATSIGFNPLAEPKDMRSIRQPSPTDVPGSTPSWSYVDQFGLYWPKWELVEWSIVTTPANPDAVGAKAWGPEVVRAATMSVVQRMESAGLKVPVLRAYALGADLDELLRRRIHPGVDVPKPPAPESATVHEMAGEIDPMVLATPTRRTGEPCAKRTLEAGDVGAGGATVGTPPSGAGPANTESAPAHHEDGVMVALMVPSDVAKKIAVPGGEKPEALHCTLAYLGKAADLGPDKIRAAAQIVQKAASEHPAMTGVIAGTGRFNATESSDGKDVIVAHPDIPTLPEMRHALVSKLDEAGIPVKKNHGFTPHITLAYVDENADSPVKRVDTTPIAFPHITLALGGS